MAAENLHLSMRLNDWSQTRLDRSRDHDDEQEQEQEKKNASDASAVECSESCCDDENRNVVDFVGVDFVGVGCWGGCGIEIAVNGCES